MWLLKPISLIDAQSNAHLISHDVPPDPLNGVTIVMPGPPRVLQRGLTRFPNTRMQVGREVLQGRAMGQFLKLHDRMRIGGTVNQQESKGYYLRRRSMRGEIRGRVLLAMNLIRENINVLNCTH